LPQRTHRKPFAPLPSNASRAHFTEFAIEEASLHQDYPLCIRCTNENTIGSYKM
jgi:hypothetical protein